jgi:hypothetical protein
VMRLGVLGALALWVTLLAGCAQAPKPLYAWETFPRLQYEALLREGASVNSQITTMDAHAEKARATGAALPPGFRAHLGMLHLSLGNADQARQLWQAEKAAFPESSDYMDRLLKRLQTPSAKSENPA